MIVKLKENYQIKIPASIIRTMGLHLGDQLDVSVRGGTICLLPLVTYPKKYLKELKDEANQLDKNIANG